MNIILMGPPGAGKGTQAKKISEELGLAHVSTGDLFRNALRSMNEFGVKANAYMEKGELVPDSLTNEMLLDHLEKNKDAMAAGFILDGYPRNVDQAEHLANVILPKLGTKIDAVLNIAVPSQKLITRLSGRRTCRDCGTSFHVEFNPPKVEGVCDNCGGELYQRADENETAVAKRLDTYDQATRPLIEYYANKGELTEINGDQSMDKVFADIKESLKG
ncbi:MAG: adenylate kinase [Erysipelotrichaceae bacterium]|nr:adenylate kinase [Erysipelotrichaceae bacterium]